MIWAAPAGWLLVASLAGFAYAEVPAVTCVPPPETRVPVDLEAELDAGWQAGGEIGLCAAADGRPQAGRGVVPPADAAEEHQRRAEHLALAKKLNMAYMPRLAPWARPLTEEQVALVARFALSDAGAVWFREMADDTLRLFNRGYLEYDTRLWQAYLDGAVRPPLSALITGRLSDAGQFAQDAAVFRIYAVDGLGATAGAASIRMGLDGFRCQFQVSGEAVDPFAVLSHEFGHSRYGDPRSAGHPRGEARTVARYENPVRIRDGFAPRRVYYLRVDPPTTPAVRDPLLARALAWRDDDTLRISDLDLIKGLLCACEGEVAVLRDCLALRRDERPLCELRWLAVRVEGEDEAAGKGR